ncbi:sucrose phosphorylase domain protein [Candidatus Erwinia dacicola]|uniref:Sucrose phosphorylase domain protein n=1 Tax=Candidatus Erwinia dacicola TaxID=252393 RepID=A0A328TRT2_9GAMM|nr:sucrose phosphorylase domain protein [Candidatus Erwinia dacicola]
MNIINKLLDKIYEYSFPQSYLQRLNTLIDEARAQIHHPRKAHWDDKRCGADRLYRSPP